MAQSKSWQVAIALGVLATALLLIFWKTESSSDAAAKSDRSAATATHTTVVAPPKLALAKLDAEAAPPTPAPSHVVALPDARPAQPAQESTEANLMLRLHNARTAKQHELAIQLAREGNKRFPNTQLAPERHSILVHSLADNEQRTDARGEAEFMVNHYPDSDWVREIERFTGAHRHSNVRLNDAGEIEYY